MAGKTLKEQHDNAIMRREISSMKLEDARTEQALKMFEALPTFVEPDEDENQWVVAGGTDGKTYTQPELVNQVRMARIQATKPAGRNVLQTMQDFIIGKTAQITAEDQNPDVQEYWTEWAEDNNFDMKSKEIIKRSVRDGESFLRWFDPKTKDDHIQLRFVDPLQIVPAASGKPTYGIETDPQDYEDVISYNRTYTESNNNLRHEVIPAAEIDHVKIQVDSDVKRGVTFFQGIGKYMTSHNKWLEDRIRLNRIRSIFNVVGEPLSGTQSISDMKGKLADTTVSPMDGKVSKKKATRSGSILFTKGIKWTLESLKINANDTKEDGRAIQLMIAIGTSFPEYITRGDASNSNYASTMVSESPFVRAMESWQDFFEKVLKKIFKRVIEDGMARGKIPPKFENVNLKFDVATENDIEEKETLPTSTDCTVNFATLIHRDMKAETDAVQIHVAEGWCSNKTASETFGYTWEEEQEEIAREQAKADAEALAHQEKFGVPVDGEEPPGGRDNDQDQDED